MSYAASRKVQIFLATDKSPMIYYHKKFYLLRNISCNVLYNNINDNIALLMPLENIFNI